MKVMPACFSSIKALKNSPNSKREPANINSTKTFSDFIQYAPEDFNIKKPGLKDKIDVFEKTNPKQNNQNIWLKTTSIAALAGVIIFAAIRLAKGKKANLKPVEDILKTERFDSEYIKTLAKDMSKALNKEISPNQLDCIMGKEELLLTLPKLGEQNYVRSAENIANGTYRADLHSHSNFSDGNGSVETILEQVSQYANKLYAKTKEKFIFALSDHDTAEGVKKALGIIAENPKKFENVRFINASELSYAHIAHNVNNPVEISELLIYGLNPFSKTANDFFTNIRTKRNNMINEFLADIKNLNPQANFHKAEMDKFYGTDGALLMNSQWQVYHYAQTKAAITALAKERNRNADDLYTEIMTKVKGYYNTLYDTQQEGFVPWHIKENWHFTNLAKSKYSPKVENGKIITSYENTLEEIVETFSKENETFLAFAHPAYLSERIMRRDFEQKLIPDYYKINEFIEDLINRSKGLIKASETYHQAYKGEKIYNSVDKINNFIRNKNLLNVGGLDNHEKDWLKLT